MKIGPRNKLTEHDETLVHALYGEGLVVAEIASKFEVSQETIRRALKRKTWSQAKQELDGASRIAIEALEKIIEVRLTGDEKKLLDESVSHVKDLVGIVQNLFPELA